MSKPLAHWRTSDQTAQDLDVHLTNVGCLSGVFASKIQLGPAGELMGLLHDLGKYSPEFQAYIKSAEGLINPDEDDYVDAQERRGKVDHSSAGAQYVWHKLFEGSGVGAVEVLTVVWWDHKQKLAKHSSAKVHQSLKVNSDRTVEGGKLDGLEGEFIPGF